MSVSDCGAPPNMTYSPGLECLMGFDYLFVNEIVEFHKAMLKIVFGWEPKRKYVITDRRDDPVFYVTEESTECSRKYLQKARRCTFTIYDKNGLEVLHMNRFFKCNRCCGCSQQVLEVYFGDTLLGSVTIHWKFSFPDIYIRDESGQPMLMLKTSFKDFRKNRIFKIQPLGETYDIGTIRMNWSRFDPAIPTDMLGINFPRNLEVKMKAVLLGACILAHFLYCRKVIIT